MHGSLYIYSVFDYPAVKILIEPISLSLTYTDI